MNVRRRKKRCFEDRGGRRGDTHKEDEVEEEQEVLDRRHAAFSHDAAPADTHRETQTGKGEFQELNAEEGGDKRWPTSDLLGLRDRHDCVAFVITSLPSNLGLIEIIQHSHLT